MKNGSKVVGFVILVMFVMLMVGCSGTHTIEYGNQMLEVPAAMGDAAKARLDIMVASLLDDGYLDKDEFRKVVQLSKQYATERDKAAPEYAKKHDSATLMAYELVVKGAGDFISTLLSSDAKPANYDKAAKLAELKRVYGGMGQAKYLKKYYGLNLE